MIACSRGDVVLVGFVFSDESGRKLRPAVVISSAAYNRAREEVVVAAITSNIRRRRFGDHLINNWTLEGRRIAISFPSDWDLSDHQANNDRSESWRYAEA